MKIIKDRKTLINKVGWMLHFCPSDRKVAPFLNAIHSAVRLVDVEMMKIKGAGPTDELNSDVIKEIGWSTYWRDEHALNEMKGILREMIDYLSVAGNFQRRQIDLEKELKQTRVYSLIERKLPEDFNYTL